MLAKLQLLINEFFFVVIKVYRNCSCVFLEEKLEEESMYILHIILLSDARYQSSWPSVRARVKQCWRESKMEMQTFRRVALLIDRTSHESRCVWNGLDKSSAEMPGSRHRVINLTWNKWCLIILFYLDVAFHILCNYFSVHNQTATSRPENGRGHWAILQRDNEVLWNPTPKPLKIQIKHFTGNPTNCMATWLLLTLVQ